MTTKTNTTRTKALAVFLGCDEESIGGISYDDELFESDLKMYLVLTDKEADDRAAGDIRESLWAFNKSFLDSYSEAIKAIPDETWREMAGKLCESFNPAVLAMVGDNLPALIGEAIRQDGRGHFLAGYDGEEHEVSVDGETLFIYRVN